MMCALKYESQVYLTSCSDTNFTKFLRIRLLFANFPYAMYPVKCHVCLIQACNNGNDANLRIKT